MVEMWPLALVAAGGLVAWGELRARVGGLRRDVDTKAGKDVLEQIDHRLERIENKLDKLNGNV